MSNRDARPLSEKALSAMHDACIEEINQGLERYGLPCLLGLHTGFRRRVLVHYDDDWREEEGDGEVIRTPKEVECEIVDGGCYDCHHPDTRGPDGWLHPKTANSEQRTIPVFETWKDNYRGKTRDTELSHYLDNYWETNSGPGWGFEARRLSKIVKTVASRRAETIAEEHEGIEEVNACRGIEEAPDIITHDLRATWATQCLRTGIGDQTVMDWGGWETIGMVEHYRGFIGDPEGTEKDKYETGRDEKSSNSGTESLDMPRVIEAFNKIKENDHIDPSEYTEAELDAAYEMLQAT